MRKQNETFFTEKLLKQICIEARFCPSAELSDDINVFNVFLNFDNRNDALLLYNRHFCYMIEQDNEKFKINALTLEKLRNCTNNACEQLYCDNESF